MVLSCRRCFEIIHVESEVELVLSYTHDLHTVVFVMHIDLI